MWKKEKKINTTLKMMQVMAQDPILWHTNLPSATLSHSTLQKYHEDTHFDNTFIINDLRIRDISWLWQKCYELHPALDSWKNIICGLCGFWWSNSGEVECSGVMGCATAPHPIRPKRPCYEMCQCVTTHKTKMTVLRDVPMRHAP